MELIVLIIHIVTSWFYIHPLSSKCAVLFLTLAAKAELTVTVLVRPNPFMHSCAHLSIVFIIGLIGPPPPEAGLAAI